MSLLFSLFNLETSLRYCKDGFSGLFSLNIMTELLICSSMTFLMVAIKRKSEANFRKFRFSINTSIFCSLLQFVFFVKSYNIQYICSNYSSVSHLIRAYLCSFQIIVIVIVLYSGQSLEKQSQGNIQNERNYNLFRGNFKKKAIA